MQIRVWFSSLVLAIMAAAGGCASWQSTNAMDSEREGGSWSDRFRPRGELFGWSERARQVEQNVGIAKR